MSLTSTGWVSKRYPEIVSELQQLLRDNVSPTLDVTSSSVIGQVVSIFAAAIASQYDLAAAVYDSGNRDKAEGKNLDDLAALIGVVRNTAFPSSGTLILKGANNTTINSGAQFKTNDNKRTVVTNTTTSLINSSCYACEVSVTSLQPSTVYNISINGSPYQTTSSATPSVIEIVSSLSAQINAAYAASPELGYSSSVVGNLLVIVSSSYTNFCNIVLGARLTPIKVSVAVTAFCTETGAIEILPESVTKISTPIAGLESVTNPLEFQTGRDVENDEELRVRMSRSVQIAGKATIPAIRAAIENITGVTSTKILENDGINTDANGLPPKSYEIIVEGGDGQTIADTVWETKPAGIQTYSSLGDAGKWLVVDSQGFQHDVYFTRPVPQYMWVKVEYSLYNEEVFPATGGEDAMKNAIVTYGKTLGVGKDVICKRFYGSIYSSVSGLSNISMTAAYTDDPVVVPDDLDYAEIIPISQTRVSRWDVARISVQFV